MPTAPNTRLSRISNKLNGRTGKTVLPTASDTKLVLYNDSFIQLAQNDNISSSNTFSRIEKTLFDFYKKADYSYNYNCAGYAIGNLNYNGGVSYSIAEAKEFLSDYTYHAGAPANVSNCIVAYGSPYTIFHYARIDNGVVSCKFGNMEELYHTGYNAYLPNDNYGTAQAYFTK